MAILRITLPTTTPRCGDLCGAILLLQVAVVAALSMVLLVSCKVSPPPPTQRIVEPIRDPKWADPQLLAVDPTGAALAHEVSVVVLAGPPTLTELPESPTAVAQIIETRHVEALSLAIDMPGPATSLVAGAGRAETWIFERPIRGSAYGLTVAVARWPGGSVAQLAAAATEIGSKDIESSGADGDLAWVVKPVEGPIQQVWAARRVGAACLLAICAAPPDYFEIALRACKTVRVDSAAP